MDIFYIIVGSIAVAILIIVLTYVGIKMANNTVSSSTKPFPPNKSTCPDYWTISSDASYCMVPKLPSGTNTEAPRNIGSIYDSTNTNTINAALTPGYDANQVRINFNDAGWSKSGTPTCTQKTWARTYGVFWDGVSNYNGCG